MKLIKIIFQILYALLVAGVVFVAAVIFLPMANIDIPYSIYSIDSGSMSPTIPVGSVVLVQTQEEYNQDDIVTFRQENNPKKVVTHRIVKVERDDDIGKYAFVTKGDANNTPDPEPVVVGRVVGKVISHVPYIGYPVGFAKTQTGFIALIIIPATLIVYQEAMNIKNEVTRMVKDQKAKKIEAGKKKAPETKEENINPEPAEGKPTTKPKPKKKPTTKKKTTKKTTKKK